MSWVLAFLGFAALIVLHELGHFAAAKAVGMRVERFALFFPPLIAKVRRGETEYAIGAVPLGGYVKITGMTPTEEIPPDVQHRAYYRQPVWKRIVVIAAGPLVNIVLAFLILWVLYMVHGFVERSNVIDRVERGSPAAGQLRAGDRLVAVDGKRAEPDLLAAEVAKHGCTDGRRVAGCRAETPAVLVVERAGTERTFRLTPVFDPEAGRTRVGFAFRPGTRREAGPVHAAGISVETMWRVTSSTVTTIARIFDPQVRREISGVVGSYERTRQTIELSIPQAIFLLGIISLSLGVINLFPFLPLDGGHIFWAVAEKLRGRAVSFQTMERAGFVGFMLVIALFLIGLTNDIGRITGEGFGVR